MSTSETKSATSGLPCSDGKATWDRRGERQELIAGDWPALDLPKDLVSSLTKLENLQHLSLSGYYFPNQILNTVELQTLAEQPSLLPLALHGVTAAADELLPALARLRSLSKLDVRGLDLMDSDIKNLAEAVPHLVELSLGWATSGEKRHVFDSSLLTPSVWSKINHFQQLRGLSLRNLPLDDVTVIAEPAILETLEWLDLGETRIGDGTAEKLSTSKTLTRLTIDGTEVGDAGAQFLARLDMLRQLDISRSKVGKLGVQRLAADAALFELGLAGLRIADGDLAAGLRLARKLRKLDLSYTTVGRSTLESLSQSTALEQLALDFTATTESDVSRLADIGIEVLSLRGVPLSVSGLESVGRLPRLRQANLEVGATWLGLDRLSATIDLRAQTPERVVLPPKLQSLELRGPLSTELRDALAKSALLKSLSIEGDASSLGVLPEDAFLSLDTLFAEDAGLGDVALELVSELPQIAELYVSGNPVSAAVSRLTSPLLNTIELRHTLADDGAIAALATLPRLHCLDVPFTRITASGVAALLRAAKNLRSLAIDASQLDASSVTAIAESQTLLELYLYGKGITDSVVAQLAPAVRLREIDLFSAKTTDEVVPSLAGLAGLRTLRLSDTAMSAAARARLHKLRPDIRVYGANVPAPVGSPNQFAHFTMGRRAKKRAEEAYQGDESH